MGRTRACRAACASSTATATSSSVIGVNSAGMPAMYSPDRLSLMVSTPYLRKHAHRGAHLLGAAHDHAEAEFGERQMRQGLVAEPARHR